MGTSLHVLNPGGKDPERTFPNGAGLPTDPGHPPINYHAYAACTGGVFVRAADSLPRDASAVLVLLRPRHLAGAARARAKLGAAGLRVLISLKESGLQQVAEALARPARWRQFVEICHAADGFLSSTQDLVPFYEAAGARSGAFVPTPYPLGEPGWDFSRPLAERCGIFIGTREFDVPARNHLAALACAVSLGEPVTAINVSGASGRRMIESISPSIRIVDGPLPYPDYLRLMASHRAVFQMDRGSVPGQVCGDALLTGTPCLGGDSALERLVAGGSSPITDSLATLREILADDDAWTAHAERAAEAGRKSLAFPVVRLQILQLIA